MTAIEEAEVDEEEVIREEGTSNRTNRERNAQTSFWLAVKLKID